MSVQVLNPNHQTSKEFTENAIKLMAIMVHKFGGHVTLTEHDISSCINVNIAVQPTEKGIEIFCVDSVKAEELAKKHGGLPI